MDSLVIQMLTAADNSTSKDCLVNSFKVLYKDVVKKEFDEQKAAAYLIRMDAEEKALAVKYIIERADITDRVVYDQHATRFEREYYAIGVREILDGRPVSLDRRERFLRLLEWKTHMEEGIRRTHNWREKVDSLQSRIQETIALTELEIADCDRAMTTSFRGLIEGWCDDEGAPVLQRLGMTKNELLAEFTNELNP
jgi:hypothetical protein